jgi:hypothetical protein
MHRLLVASSFALLGTACAHAPAPACPHPPQSAATQAVASTPPAFGFADPAAFQEAEPLALYNVRWMLLSGDSGALVEMARELHPFTLGRWECALSAESASDTFGAGRAEVKRTRRVACTHPTGLTMQTELACGFAMPARPGDGSPRAARREARIALGDAPSMTLACEPFATERLSLKQADKDAVAEVCLRDATVATCAP